MERRRDAQHPDSHEDPAAAGLNLVERTAELIRATEDHAAELAARSAAAVAHLQEEMRLAERVLEAAETRRRIAEAEVKKLRSALEESEKAHQERIDLVTLELRTALVQSEKTYETRIDELTVDLLATQRRAAEAEARAAEAESALERIQSAMEGILRIRSPAEVPDHDAQQPGREDANGRGEGPGQG
jgi:hypothetical protein